MDELLAEFIAETRETLELVSGEIVDWESHLDDGDRLDAIFRFIHTVKGSCGFLDLPRLEKLSHAAEGALMAVRSGERHADRALVDAILAAIDRIAELVDTLDDGGSIAVGEDDDLIRVLEGAERAERAGGDPRDDSQGCAVSGAARATPTRSIRVPVDLLDRLMGGVSDLVLARNELSRQLRGVRAGHQLDFAFERISSCVAEMRDAITWTRMQRIESLFAALPRLVRDLSAELGKPVAIEIDGGDVELDREMIEMLRDPLTHIVRNAIDHGIEAKGDRIAAGKPATGLIDVSARQSGNQIHILLRDDGRGIDTARLIEKAIERGKLDAEGDVEAGSQQAIELIFDPGLSTAPEVSAISGRGVGMDVVRANIERIGGSVEIESSEGRGTQITLSVPLTLTIIPALIIGVGDHQFAIPRPSIEEIVDLGKGAVTLETIGGVELALLRDERLPVVRMSTILGEARNEDDSKMIVVRPGRKQRYALLASSVFDHEELVAKPAAPGVMQAGIYAGTALPDDGRPLLLLDVQGISECAGLALDRIAPEPSADGGSGTRRSEALLFEDLDGRKRAVRLGVIDRIVACDVADIGEHGGRLRAVLDGAIVPVATAGPLPDQGPVRMLRFSDGQRALAYAVRSTLDVVLLPEDPEPVDAPGRIWGVALVEGEPVELLDPFTLFAELPESLSETAGRPLCRIVGDDPTWAREFLAPVVERAGYQVIFGDDLEARDPALVIDLGGEAGEAAIIAPETRVLRLRDQADARGEAIARYDRAAIDAALRAGAAQ